MVRNQNQNRNRFMSKTWSSTEVQMLLSATAGTDQQHKGSQQGFEIKIKIEIGSCLKLGVHPATGQCFELKIKKTVHV